MLDHVRLQLVTAKKHFWRDTASLGVKLGSWMSKNQNCTTCLQLRQSTGALSARTDSQLAGTCLRKHLPGIGLSILLKDWYRDVDSS
ncbi:hypothetical protein Tco_1125747 [Tanacetum coccineum]